MPQNRCRRRRSHHVTTSAHSPEQIIRKLREGARLLGEKFTIEDVCSHLEISDSTWYRRQNQYGGMKADDAERLEGDDFVDTEPGLSPEDADRVFERFHRTDRLLDSPRVPISARSPRIVSGHSAHLTDLKMRAMAVTAPPVTAHRASGADAELVGDRMPRRGTRVRVR